jgi:hypothetical protein
MQTFWTPISLTPNIYAFCHTSSTFPPYKENSKYVIYFYSSNQKDYEYSRLSAFSDLFELVTMREMGFEPMNP